MDGVTQVMDLEVLHLIQILVQHGNTGYSDFASPSSTTASQDFSTQAVSGGQTDYDGGGGNDYSGPTDPGLAGKEAVTWNIDKEGNLSVKSTPDSITDYGQNLQSEIQSQIKQSGIKGLTNKLAWAINPVGKAIGTAAGVGVQTLAANYLLGNIANPFSTWTSPAGDWFAKNAHHKLVHIHKIQVEEILVSNKLLHQHKLLVV
jgi:hypothetical protein